MGRGIYILLIWMSGNKKIRIGELGVLKFPGGLYAYVGSAQGNLEKRLERHIRREKKKFWHIDYLLENAKILEAYIKRAPKKQECETAKLLGEIFKPVPKFGCSDCNCGSHLFFLGNGAVKQEI